MFLSTLIIPSCKTTLHSHLVILIIQQIINQLTSFTVILRQQHLLMSMVKYSPSPPTQFFSQNYHINFIIYTAVCITFPNEISHFARFGVFFLLVFYSLLQIHTHTHMHF